MNRGHLAKDMRGTGFTVYNNYIGQYGLSSSLTVNWPSRSRAVGSTEAACTCHITNFLAKSKVQSTRQQC